MRIILSDFMSLDGVVQAPGGPEEDTELISTTTTGTGVLVCTYRPARR